VDFSNYEKQAPRAGHTVAYEVTELVNADGSHPIIHAEHLGRGNFTFMEELLSEAGGKEREGFTAAIGKARERVIKHSARRLENAFGSDGAAATDADLPGFIRAMPIKAFERFTAFVTSDEQFCELPIAVAPQVLAEK
jgi:hypothetical protein